MDQAGDTPGKKPPRRKKKVGETSSQLSDATLNWNASGGANTIDPKTASEASVNPLPPPPVGRSPSVVEEPSLIRSTLGAGTVTFSEMVNNNLITARYAAFASIGLLTAYGLVHTPFFFRYRTVSEIPASYFRNRNTIKCRLIKIVDNETAATTTRTQTASSPSSTSPPQNWLTQPQLQQQPIRLQVRHLSPAEQLLSRAWFDKLMSIHPAATVLGKKRPDQSPHELLEIEMAGIQSPPDYFVTGALQQEQHGEWLRRLVAERTVVNCQLLARRVKIKRKTGQSAAGAFNSSSFSQFSKRMAPGLEDLEKPSSWELWEAARSTEQRAVCKLFYRPQLFQGFATDIGQSMVRYGRAVPSGEGLFGGNGGGGNTDETYEEKVLDATDSIKQLKKDADYLISLDQAEYEAAKSSYGMWADPDVRRSRPDVLEEVEFQTKATKLMKIWRWLRGG